MPVILSTVLKIIIVEIIVLLTLNAIVLLTVLLNLDAFGMNFQCNTLGTKLLLIVLDTINK